MGEEDSPAPQGLSFTGGVSGKPGRGRGKEEGVPGRGRGEEKECQAEEG